MSVIESDLAVESPVAASRFSNPLAIAWRRKGLILLGIITGLAMGALYYSQKDPTYQSTAQVLVVKKRADAVPLAGGASNAIQPIFVEDYLATHTVLLRSEELLRRAAQELEKVAPEAIPPGADGASFISNGLTVARENRDGQATAPSNVLNISFRGGNAEHCAKVVVAVIEAYKAFLNETYGDLNKQFVEQMEKAQKLLDQDIREKQLAHEKIADRDPLALKAKDALHTLQDRIGKLESRRADLMLRQTELETSRDLIEAALKRGTPRATILRTIERGAAFRGTQLPSAANPRGPEELLANLLMQEEELRQELGKDHPQLATLRRRIQAVRDRMGSKPTMPEDNIDPLDLHLQALRYELEENQTLQKTLMGILKEERIAAKETATFLLEEEKARKAIERPQQLYDNVIARLQQIRFAGDNDRYSTRTIVEARPGMKVAPSLIVTAALAILLGGMIGVGLAYLAEYSDESFRTPEEIRRQLGVPVMGHVPFIPAHSGPVAAVVGEHLRAFHDPKSREAEAIRGLRTALYFSTQGRGHQVLQMTSPSKGDGKSTLLANLAVSIAQSGKSVVLVDADFRRPTVHRLFRLGDTPAGVASVLAGTVELPDAVRSCEAIPGLSVLPCGPRPANPAELLTSPRFQELLAILRERYDFVLVDTPPLLAVTDPSVVAPRVDGVILTLRMSKNVRPLAERAKEVLASVGANCIGVVVNGMEGTQAHYGPDYNYGYNYNYSYSYEAYDEEDTSQRPTAPSAGRNGPVPSAS